MGVDASIANAFRRILIAEVRPISWINLDIITQIIKVPVIAIERVYVWDNTSVIVDEVLSHRLGLVPLNVDPALMQFKTRMSSGLQQNSVFFIIKL